MQRKDKWQSVSGILNLIHYFGRLYSDVQSADHLPEPGADTKA